MQSRTESTTIVIPHHSWLCWRHSVRQLSYNYINMFIPASTLFSFYRSAQFNGTRKSHIKARFVIWCGRIPMKWRRGAALRGEPDGYSEQKQLMNSWLTILLVSFVELTNLSTKGTNICSKINSLLSGRHLTTVIGNKLYADTRLKFANNQYISTVELQWDSMLKQKLTLLYNINESIRLMFIVCYLLCSVHSILYYRCGNVAAVLEISNDQKKNPKIFNAVPDHERVIPERHIAPYFL